MGNFVFVGPVHGSSSLFPGEMGRALSVLLIDVLVLLLLGFDGLLVFFQLALFLHVGAPFHHLTSPLLETQRDFLYQILQVDRGLKWLCKARFNWIWFKKHHVPLYLEIRELV